MDLTDDVRRRALLQAGRPAVVMLSGGRDSVCLLDVAVRVAGTEAVQAVHVNYGLREESGQDEAFCRALCARVDVDLEVITADPPPHSGNLQAWARELRYIAARGLAAARQRESTEPPADIAAGHTATDQVETILYRLAAAPSRRALLGMTERDGQLIRPLLSYTREQTTAHCTARGLTWRDDPSNDTDRFARGRVRHELVPALRRVHPAAEANVLALAEILRAEADVLGELVGGVLQGEDAITLEQLRALPVALARLIVQRLADRAVGAPAPGVSRRLPDILQMRDTGTAHLDLPSGVRATAHRGRLTFSARPRIDSEQ